MRVRGRLTTPADEFRNGVRRARERKGWTQTDLAKRLRTQTEFPATQSTVSRIESGDRAVTIDEAFALADVLDVAPAALIAPEPPDLETIRARAEEEVRRMRGSH